MTQWPVRGFIFASDVSTSNWMLWRGPERQVPSEGLIITLKKGWEKSSGALHAPWMRPGQGASKVCSALPSARSATKTMKPISP